MAGNKVRPVHVTKVRAVVDGRRHYATFKTAGGRHRRALLKIDGKLRLSKRQFRNATDVQEYVVRLALRLISLRAAAERLALRLLACEDERAPFRGGYFAWR